MFILLLSILFANGVLFVNIYTSVVDARSWGSDIPASIEASRVYGKKYNPGSFFRKFSPMNQVLGLLALIVCWSVLSVRIYAGIAFVVYLLVDLFTFRYFYPRNEIMFRSADLSETGKLTKTWQEWSRMNWIRSLLIFTGLCFSLMAMYELCLNTFRP